MKNSEIIENLQKGKRSLNLASSWIDQTVDWIKDEKQISPITLSYLHQVVFPVLRESIGVFWAAELREAITEYVVNMEEQS